MPTRSLAAICLAAALVVGLGTGATAGAAGAVPGWVPDPFGLSRLDGPLASVVDGYERMRFGGESSDGLQKAEVAVRVPSGWTDIERTALWHDLRDPTGQITLRLRAELTGGSVYGARDAAMTELRTLETELEKFDLIGERRIVVTTSGEADRKTLPGYEIRYTYLQNGRKRYGAERYIGDDDPRMVVAGYQWSDRPDVITPILDEAVRSMSSSLTSAGS